MKASPLAVKRLTQVIGLRINTNETFELRYDRRMSTTSKALTAGVGLVGLLGKNE